MPQHTAAPVVIDCVASGVLVDPRPPLQALDTICPACGARVMIGGTISAPRYANHVTISPGVVA